MSRQLFQYHPVIGHTFIPHLKARVEHESGGYLVKVNGAGFRSNREFVSEKSDQKKRVLLFGDSFTAGDGVGNKYRYSDLLEQMRPDLEVYNFGLSGTGTDQQYLAFSEIGKKYDHDLVVISVLVENIRRVASRFRPYENSEGKTQIMAKPYCSYNQQQGLVFNHIPVPKDPIDPSEVSSEDWGHVDAGGSKPLLRKLIGSLGPKVKTLAQKVTKFQPVPAYGDPSHPDWVIMREIIKKWVGECQKPVILFPIPLYHFVEELSDPRDYLCRFRELSDELGVKMVDPLEQIKLVPRAERRGFRFESDIHPTPQFHEVLAKSLLSGINLELQ